MRRFQDDPYAALGQRMPNDDPYASLGALLPQPAPRPAPSRPQPQAPQIGAQPPVETDPYDPNDLRAAAVPGGPADAAAALARYRQQYPDDPNARAVNFGEAGYPGSDSRWDEQSRTYVARGPVRPGSAFDAWAGGAAEQIPGLNLATAGLSSMLNGVPFDEARRLQKDLASYDRENNRDARNLGGVSGFAATTLLPGGRFIRGAEGASVAGRAFRASAVNGGYGFAAGALNGDGNLQERLQRGAVTSGVSAVLGAGLEGAGGALANNATRRAASPSPQRNLSNYGIPLTPGQMAGGWLQTAEDALAGTVPIVGDAINSARRRGLETFDNVATNMAIEPIGVRLDNTAGRQGVRTADDAISQAYQSALGGVTVSPDAPYTAAVGAAHHPAGLTPDANTRLNAITDNILAAFNDGPVTGETWKAADSQLAAAIRAADQASQGAPEMAALRDRLSDVRDAVGGMLERPEPFAYRDTRAADRATAQYRLVRKASSDVASAGRDGNSSPATLNRAVRGAGERQYGRGESLLQDLSDDAMRVLPSTVPNSGTAIRNLVGGGMGLGAMTNPQAILPAVGLMAGGAALYSRPVQGLLNAAYRAKRPGLFGGAAGGLSRYAGETPALQQYVLQQLLNRPADDRALARGR